MAYLQAACMSFFKLPCMRLFAQLLNMIILIFKISQVFTYDPSQGGQVTEILEKLLKDMSTMVLGSALAAFQEICPTQYGLLHSHYRKLCSLMVDMDEWSQVSQCSI